MEKSDMSDLKSISTGRGYLEASPLGTHCITNPNNIKSNAICRVCMRKPKVRINIFSRTPGSRISIAKMISQCTGYAVSKADPYPNIICPPCLSNAECAFQLKQTYKRSYRFFYQMNRKVRRQKALVADEIHTIPDPVSERSSPDEENQHFDCQVESAHVELKLEIEEDLWMNEDSCGDESECQVKNELMEDDSCGDESECQVKNELMEDEEFEKDCELDLKDEDSDYISSAEKSIKDESSTLKLPLKCMQSHMYSARSSIKFKFQPGSRQGSRLIHTLDDNQLYCKNKTLKNGDFAYICRVKNCRARVYLAKDETQVFASADNVQHSHGSQVLEIRKIIAMDDLKTRCQNDNLDLKTAFNNVMAGFAQDGAEIKISYDSLKRTLQRKKRPGRLTRMNPTT